MEGGTLPSPGDSKQTERMEALEREGRFPELATELSAAAARATGAERAAILARLGEVRLRLDDIARALEMFAASLELDPNQQGSRRWLEVLLAEPAHALSAAELLEPIYEREYRKVPHSAVMLLAILELRANRATDQDERIATWVQFGATFDQAAVPAERAREIAVRLLARTAAEWPGGVAKWIERLTRFTADPLARLDGLLAPLKQPLSDAASIACLSAAAGDALVELDRLPEARALYERALASDPTAPELLARLDATGAGTEEPSVREKRYTDAISRTDEIERRTLLRVALGQLQHGALKSPEAALETLRQAIGEAPQSLAAHRALASVLEAQNDEASLVKELKRARAALKGEDRLPATRKMAEVLMKSDRGDEALALVAPLVDEPRLDDETLDLIERLSEEKSELGTLRQVHEHRIQNASDAGARARALEAFGDLLSGQLEEPVAAAATWKSAAELLAEIDESSSEPIRLYERALGATPSDAGAARRLVELTAGVGDWNRLSEAFAKLLTACESILDVVPSVLALEARAAQTGGVDAFAALSDDVVARLDDDHQAEMRALVTAKARVLAAAGRYDEAARVYEALIESFADEPDVRAYVGLLEGHPSATWRHTKRSWLFDWRTANAEDPTAVLLHWATVEEQEFEDLAAAVRLLERAAKESPNRVEVWRELARLRIMTGDVELGVEALGRLRELGTNGHAADIALSMAELLVERLDRAEQALPLLEAASSAHPENPRVRELLMKLWLLPATRVKAVALSEAASLAADPPERQRETLRQLLESTEQAAREGDSDLAALRRRWFERLVALESGDAALALFERAAAEFPTDAGIWDAVEQGAIRAKQPESAVRAYSGALERALDAKIAEQLAERLVAFAEEHVGNPAALTAPLEHLLALAPSARWAFERVKLGLTREQRWDALFSLYERVMAATADEAERLSLLDEAAIAARDLANEPERAIGYWERYFVLRPRDERVDVALERLYERRRKLEELISHLTRREQNLEGEDLVRARERVAGLWLELGRGREALLVLEGQPKQAERSDSTLALLERVFRLPLASEEPTGSEQREVKKRAAKLLKERYAESERAADVANVVVAELSSDLATKAERVALLRHLAELRRGLGDGAAEFESLGELTLLEPEEDSHRARLSELSLALAKRAQFAGLMVAAAESVPGKALFAELLGAAARIYLELNERDRAIELFARILNDSDSVTTRLEAAAELERHLLEAGRSGERCSVLERMADLSQDAAARRQLLLEAARVALDELGEPLRAAQAYRRLLETEPRDRALIDGLLKALRVGERWLEVVAALEERASIEPESPRARRDRGEAARLRAEKLGDVPAAIEAWQAVRRSFGRDAESFELLSQHFETLGRFHELAELLSEEALATPAAAPLYARLAEVHRRHTHDLPASLAAYMRANDLVAAAELFCEHDELVPDDPALALDLAQRLEQDKNTELAERVLRRQIQHYGPRRPRDGVRVHLSLAALLNAVGRGAQAVEELSAAAERYPESGRVLSALGALSLKLSDFARAEHSYRSLLMVLGRARDEGEPAPSRGEVYLHLSQVALSRGDAAAANEHVASAFEAALGSEEEAVQLEAALERLGRLDLLERAISVRLDRARDPAKVAFALLDLLKVNATFSGIEPAVAERASKLAERALRDLESAGGSETRAFRALLEVFQELGDSERVSYVLDLLSARATSDREIAEYALLTAQHLLKLPGNRDEAIKKLRLAVERDPESAKAFELLTVVLGDDPELERLLEAPRAELAAAEKRGDRGKQESLARRLLLTYEKLGRLRDAVDVLGELAKIPECRAEALARIVRLHEELGTQGREYADALEALLGVATEPERAATLALRLCELRRADGDGAGVERALNRGFVLAPGDARLSNALVSELLSRGGHVRAVEVIERAIEHHPRDAGLHLALADALGKSGDAERALLALDAAVAAGASDAAARRERARILEGLGRFEEALGELEAALRAQPGASEELLVAIERTGLHQSSERWALRASDILSDGGQRQRARELLRPWLERHADSVALLTRVAKLAMAERDFEAALDAYKKLVKLEQGSARRSAALGLARAAESAGRPEMAVAEVEAVLSDGLDSVELRRELGRLYARTGDRVKQARIVLDEARATRGAAQFELFAKAAELFASEQASDEALAALRELCKLDPERPESQLLHANGLVAAGRAEQAYTTLAAFLKSTEKRHTKTHAKLFLRLGELALLSDDWALALPSLVAAHHLDRSDGDIAFTLGLLAFDLDEIELSLTMLRGFATAKDKATDLPTRRQLSRACLVLAELELGKGQKTVARRMATRAAEADPQNKEAQRFLTDVALR